MKRQKLRRIKVNHWFALLVITDLFFIFLAWLIGPDVIGSIVIIIILFTVIIFFAGCWLDRITQKKKMEKLNEFLNDPNQETEYDVLATVDESWHPAIRAASAKLRDQAQTIKDKQLDIQNYQDFIEAWTHEIKTPLSLSTLILGNHKEEMSTYVFNRMEHVCRTINNDVDRVLYYARLQADHVDYNFVKIDLSDCVKECLEDFEAISEEKNIDVQLNLPQLQIVSDKKVFIFMLSQLLSNAFKYTAPVKGLVSVVGWSTHDDKKIHLAVRDNGKGVPPEDMPFIFDKGFTGNHPDRQNATGMGLYLVQKFAEALSIEVKVEETPASGQGFDAVKDEKTPASGQGLGIELIFSAV